MTSSSTIYTRKTQERGLERFLADILSENLQELASLTCETLVDDDELDSVIDRLYRFRKLLRMEKKKRQKRPRIRDVKDCLDCVIGDDEQSINNDSNVPTEAWRLVAASGFSTSVELGRFMVLSSKQIYNHLGPEYCWKTICNARWNSTCVLNNVQLNYRSLFHQLLNKTVVGQTNSSLSSSPSSKERRWPPLASPRLQAEHLVLLVNLVDEVSNQQLLSCAIHGSSVTDLLTTGGVHVPLDHPIPVRSQTTCTILDTGQINGMPKEAMFAHVRAAVHAVRLDLPNEEGEKDTYYKDDEQKDDDFYCNIYDCGEQDKDERSEELYAHHRCICLHETSEVYLDVAPTIFPTITNTNTLMVRPDETTPPSATFATTSATTSAAADAATTATTTEQATISSTAKAISDSVATLYLGPKTHVQLANQGKDLETRIARGDQNPGGFDVIVALWMRAVPICETSAIGPWDVRMEFFQLELQIWGNYSDLLYMYNSQREQEKHGVTLLHILDELLGWEDENEAKNDVTGEV